MGRIIDEAKGLYTIISIDEFRKIPDVEFMVIAGDKLPRVDEVDKVLHQPGAISPGMNDKNARTWYMHPSQDDNLLVLQGERNVQIYIRKRTEKLSLSKLLLTAFTKTMSWCALGALYSFGHAAFFTESPAERRGR